MCGESMSLVPFGVTAPTMHHGACSKKACPPSCHRRPQQPVHLSLPLLLFSLHPLHALHSGVLINSRGQRSRQEALQLRGQGAGQGGTAGCSCCEKLAGRCCKLGPRLTCGWLQQRQDVLTQWWHASAQGMHGGRQQVRDKLHCRE